MLPDLARRGFPWQIEEIPLVPLPASVRQVFREDVSHHVKVTNVRDFDFVMFNAFM